MQNVARLYTQFIPEHYELSLDLDRPGRLFTGTVTIRGMSPGDSGTIRVHAKDLEIHSATLDGKEASFKADKDDELVITHPDIKTGKHIVVIAFSGKITDGMHGLYPCYFEHDGIKKELLATQFESHHAREAFPCIDEPEAKATFNLTLTTEQGVTVLSNMQTKKQTSDNDRLVTSFQTTPRMSTYLLAWVVGELHKKTAQTNSGVEVNIWATPAQNPEKLDFALEHAVKTIEFFDNYFDTPYPLPKSDHVALPDFTAGAMENWGLITYREVALLAHPTVSSISSKQYVARVIAHELSHQWFGNLVTMKWWEDLWLNESFASLMEYIALDTLHPEWNIWLEMSNFRNIQALRRDSIDGVQPVRTGVSHPDEISTLFDAAIVYAKGARLLRMLQHYVGKEAFQNGLALYFQAHAYSNTEANDLWSAITAASGKDINEFMNTWISQPGYPVVDVVQKDDHIALTQKRFFIGPHKPADTTWPIPLDSPDLPEILTDKEMIVETPTSLIQLNISDSAHFLTNYSPSLLHQLAKHVDVLPPLNRLQLLQQQALLARGGEASMASLIQLLLGYKNEADQSVWDVINLAVNELKQFVEGDEKSEKKLKQLTVSLAQAQYQRLGWHPHDGEPESETKLRANIIAAMLYGEDPDALKTAAQLYQTTALESLEPELRALIIGSVIRHDTAGSVISELIEHYKQSVSADLKDDIAYGLSFSTRPEEINKLLALIIDGVVRPQDVVHWFSYIIRSRYGREIAWAWIRENWPWIKKTFSGDKSFDYFPRIIGNHLKTARQLQEYRDFFDPMKDEPALARIISMGISEIEGNVALIERETSKVREALEQL